MHTETPTQHCEYFNSFVKPGSECPAGQTHMEDEEQIQK